MVKTMREVLFSHNIKFDFKGNVTRNALIIGDADNDSRNEIVCANLQGDLGIFKGSSNEPFAKASNLGMITACCIGDFTNIGKNLVAGINMEGWLYLFDVTSGDTEQAYSFELKESFDNTVNSSTTKNSSHDSTCLTNEIAPFYQQRMPANCKTLLVADLDGDGHKEIIIALTDRVLRTYRWVMADRDRGKFVGIYKWEFADQIGSISLNPSDQENCLDIIVAQPGGTFAKLDCMDKKSTPSLDSTQENSQLEEIPIFNEDNVRTERVSRLTPEYHQLVQTKMRNQHISTEVLGGIRNNCNSRSCTSIVVVTLDGSVMVVNNDKIPWSLQLEPQLFALASFNYMITQPSTSNQCTARFTKQVDHQFFVVCAWNGKTYIFDENRTPTAFKFDDAVSSFTAGSYYFNGSSHPSLVYATFNNQIIVYHDIISEVLKPNYFLGLVTRRPENFELQDKLLKIAESLGLLSTTDRHYSRNSIQHTTLRLLLRDIVTNVHFKEDEDSEG